MTEKFCVVYRDLKNGQLLVCWQKDWNNWVRNVQYNPNKENADRFEFVAGKLLPEQAQQMVALAEE